MSSFIDEAMITVEGGKGGDGCAGFLRAKCLPKGGPNGGDGGSGGSVYLVAVTSPNTLIAFRYQRSWVADSGQNGMTKQCTGLSGKDLEIPVPIGTIVYEANTRECLGDLSAVGQRLLVAKGGRYGLGNVHFKSSTNRAPRQTTQGKPGEKRTLCLELTVLADVGLLGLPNAGKSTLIRAISAARPKVADYPFTTLRPYLGVVSVPPDQSFVVADIPGLIEGASQGHGLGFQFLKHLSRTQLLWHIVSLETEDLDKIAHDIHVIEQELSQYDPVLAQKERWLVFNKIDLFSKEVLDAMLSSLLKILNWKGRVFLVSAVSKRGTEALCFAWAELQKQDVAT